MVGRSHSAILPRTNSGECIYRQWKLKYHILSKTLSSIMPRTFRHLVSIRMGMNKMAEGDEYLDYSNETLQRTAKSWGS